MKKNIIIYIIAGVVAVAGIGVAGILGVGKIIKSKGETTEPTLDQYDSTDYGEDGVPIITPDTEELHTNENGELIEYQTDAEGNTVVVVLQTNPNGEVVTKPNGEVATQKPPQVVTTKPSSKPNSDGDNSEDVGLNNDLTIQETPDGKHNIVKPDGSIALSYSYSETGNYFYTDDDPWQRNFGFNRVYDIGAIFTFMYLDTFHVYYNHNGYDWMVQFWKGQYGFLFLGGEIGLYYKDPAKSTPHYNCAEEDMEINMQMTVYRDGYGELFTRPYAPHWWTTAFVPGKLKKFSDRSELTMVAKLEFKSVEEREKFCNALEKITDIDGNHFKYASKLSKNKPEYYTYNGTTVDLVWRYLDEDRKTPLKPVTEPSTTETTTQQIVTQPPSVEE